MNEWDLSHMVQGPTHLALPPCLSVTIVIGTSAYKSDPRAKLSEEIVWYDALAPRPEVLLSLCFVCAGAMLPLTLVLTIFVGMK